MASSANGHSPGARPVTSRGSRSDVASISAIYARNAELGIEERQPIVFIPGILGSRLVDSGSTEAVWGDFHRTRVDPKRAENRRRISLPMEQGVPLDRLASPAEADGVLREASTRRLPVTVGVYRDIMGAVGIQGHGAATTNRPDYESNTIFASFEFGYDWRRSLDEAARQLGDFLRLASYFVRATRQSSEPVRFDVVAHSMGGLVLRYFLRYGAQPLPADGSLPRLTWAGCEFVRRAVVIGTPNAGSSIAISRLVTGMPGQRFIHAAFDPLVVGTMPSIYQLLPRHRHRPFVTAGGDDAADLLDPEFWIGMRWGLANPDGDDLLELQLDGVDSRSRRREVALDHLAKCLRAARTFQAAIDCPATRPPTLELHAVAGDGLRTPAVVTAEPGVPRVRTVAFGAGDGTVLRSSVLLDERVGGTWESGLKSPIDWSSIFFANSEHLALTRDRVVVNNVLFRVLGEAP